MTGRENTFAHIVVGGGIHGCAAAYELALRERSVLLLEATTLAAGASGGPGQRGVRASQRDHRELPLIRQAYRRWPNLARELGARTGFVQRGSMYLYERHASGSKGGTVSLPVRHGLQEAHGIPSAIIGAEEVRQYLPGVSDTITAGLYCPWDGTAEHKATTVAYASAARRHAAQIHEHKRVTGIEPLEGSAVSVQTESGHVYTATQGVLIATNANLATLANTSELPIWTVYPQVIILTVPWCQLPLDHLVGHDHRSASVKRLDEETVMLSGGWRGEFDPEPAIAIPQPDQVEGNLKDATAIFPALANASVRDVLVDRPESVTIDQLPVIDKVPGLGATFVATGWSGHGFAIAPTIATMVADWMTTDKRPDPLIPFSWHRFGLQ